MATSGQMAHLGCRLAGSQSALRALTGPLDAAERAVHITDGLQSCLSQPAPVSCWTWPGSTRPVKTHACGSGKESASSLPEKRATPWWSAAQPWLGYAVAVAGTAVAAALRWAIGRWVGEVSPLTTFYPAVIIAALLGGTGPGLLATLLGALAADFLFLPPVGRFGPFTSQYLAQMGLFIVVNIGLSWLGGRLRLARVAIGSSETRYRRLFEASGDGILLLDSASGRITDANPAIVRLLDRPPQEVIGKHLWEIGLLKDPQTTQGALVHLVRHGSLHFRHLPLQSHTEVAITVEATCNLYDEAGRSVIQCHIRDITERTRQEEKLREQAHLTKLRADLTQTVQQLLTVQALLQEASKLLVERLEAAFVRVWTLDSTGQTLELQASAGLYTHLDGAHSRVPVGQLKIGRIAQERRPLCTNQVLGDPNVPEQDWARREGLVAFAGFPLLLEGRLLGVLALFARHRMSATAIDTCESIAGVLAQTLGRLTAEQALRAAKEDLARSNLELEAKVLERTAKLQETVAELEGFSYSLVHDLRAPLRAMQAYASILESEAAARLEPEHTDLLRKIRIASKRMDQLVTDSLNYTYALRQTHPLSPVNVGDLLHDLVETYPDLQAPAADIQIEIADLLVQSNQAALTQVFSNLLGNAVKFVAPGVHPHVRVWAQVPTDSQCTTPSAPRRVLIWVEDNGIGIPKEAQERIFGMFQRLHRTDEYPGTGMGLALVKKSLERTGGQVCLDSEPGRGSRFCVHLPLASLPAGASRG